MRESELIAARASRLTMEQLDAELARIEVLIEKAARPREANRAIRRKWIIIAERGRRLVRETDAGRRRERLRRKKEAA
jgi:hypothetical protein